MSSPDIKRSKRYTLKTLEPNQTYSNKYAYIVNCLSDKDKYLNIKKAVSSFLYRRGENKGGLIDRRKTIELCSNKKLENMFIENPRIFNFAEDIVCCSICGKRINENDKVEIDHLIPSTFFFVLFARYYHVCKHPHITKQEKGQQMCDEYIDDGAFVTKMISITHKGCNQAKSDAMFFEIIINGRPYIPESTWTLRPNEPVINEFINRYINKLYPTDGVYTGMGYMNATRFEEHARMLTNNINKDTMEVSMTTRLNTFVQNVCSSYKGGNMGHIFENLHLLNNVTLTLIDRLFDVDVTDYFDEIREKYDIDSILSSGILIDKTITTRKLSDRLPRNTKFASVPSFFIESNVPEPSFEQVCELIDYAIEKKDADQTKSETTLGLGFVRKKTKRIKKIIKRRPTKANKTRSKRT
jgi:hypothetical protein